MQKSVCIGVTFMLLLYSLLARGSADHVMNEPQRIYDRKGAPLL